MKQEEIQVHYFEDPDVYLLSRTKALLSHHLESNASSHLIGTLYMDLGQIYQRIRNYPLAHQAWENASGCFDGERERLYRATAYYQQGILYFQERQIVLALKRWQQVLEVLAYAGREGLILRAQAAYELGRYFLSVGNIEEAKGYLEEGLLFARQGGHGKEEVLAMQELARVFHRIGNPVVAIRIYQNALGKCRQMKNDRLLASIINDLGYLYEERKEWKRAVSAFRYSLAVQPPDSPETHRTLVQLARIFFKIDPEQTRQYCQQAIEGLLTGLIHRFNEQQEKQLAQVFELMGLYCREKNDRKNMLMFFRQSLEIYRKNFMEPQWNEVYQIYSKYIPADEQYLYDESKTLVNGLPKHEKLRCNLSIS